MKNLFTKILLAITILISSYSCSAGWLDVNPSDEANAETAITTLKDAEIALNGVYLMIKGYRESSTEQYFEYYGAHMVFYGDMRADDVQLGEKHSNRSEWLYQLNFSRTTARDMWYIPYKVIYRANRLLQTLEGGLNNVAEADLDNIRGQALMARSLAHFDLLKLYSNPYDLATNGDKYGVPIVTKTAGGDYKPGRDKIKDVYDQVIKDLNDASTMMKGNNKSGYFNLWAAKALQARVYLYMGDNKKALELAEDVITKSPYKLWATNDYVAAWTLDPTSQASSEILFQIMITNNTDWLDREGAAYIMAHDGYEEIHLSKNFYDMINKDYANDVRLGMFIVGQKGAGGDNVAGKKVWINKYGPKAGGTDARISNIPLLRLSETYLIASEAALKSGDKTKAAKYLNDIYLRGTPTATAVASADVTLDRILKERRIELVGEGQRYFDLVRNNLEIVRYTSLANIGWYLPLSSTDAQKYNRDYYKSILPIPMAEMEANSGLEGQQNPGY